MTDVWAQLAGSIVLGWLVHHLPRMADRAIFAYAIGALLVFGGALVGWVFAGLWIAVLAPFGTMLPVLCLSGSARRAGWIDPPALRWWELLVAAGLMLLVVLGAGGVIPIHPYGWFYGGAGPAALAVLLGIYALWRGYHAILIAVVLAQVMWLTDSGSSNLYDHLAHLLLIPAAIVSAMMRRVR